MQPESIKSPLFLVGIDLEPLPLTDPDHARSWDELETLTTVVLAFLHRHRWQATFFTVGEVAKRLPSLVAAIAEEGHEIACHTHSHDRLDRMGRDGFRRDVEMNVAALEGAGVRGVTGFRAPFFSLTESAGSWAYEALRDCGITYSSSVSYSRNLSGWSERAPMVARKAGIIELPVSSLWTGPLGAPLGGLYWRCCPQALLVRQLRRMAAEASYLTSFFHAHDFHSEKAKYVEPRSFLRSPVSSVALAIGRKSVERKLALVSELGFSFCSFREFLQDEDARRRNVRIVAAAK